MSNTTNRIWDDRPGGGAAGGKGRSPLRRALTFFLILTVTLGVVLAAAWRDGTGFDALRRYVSYAGPLSGGQPVVYEYEPDPSNRFAAVGSGALAVLSDTALHLLGPDGGHLWSENVQMTAPALHSGGGRAVAYDVGGEALYVLDETGLLLSLTAEGPILSARLNGLGMLAVTVSSGSGKGVVSVYDPAMELAFVFTSQRRFLADACVSDDGRYLAAAALGQEESVFVSHVVLYRLTEKEPAASFPVVDGLVLAMEGQAPGRILAVTDTCLTSGTLDGTILGNYAYGGAYLREYDLSGDGYAVLLLGDYRSGSQGKIVTVDAQGEAIASLEIREEVQDLSVCGRYVTVLYTDRCVVYDQALNIYAAVPEGAAARQILTREDGSVLMIGSDRAEVFLP